MRKNLLKHMDAFSKKEIIFATQYKKGMEDGWIVKNWIDADDGFETLPMIFKLKKEAKKYAKENHLDAYFVPVFLEPVSEYEYNLLSEYGYSGDIIMDTGKYYQYEEIEEDSWVMYIDNKLCVVSLTPWELGYTESIRE